MNSTKFDTDQYLVGIESRDMTNFGLKVNHVLIRQNSGLEVGKIRVMDWQNSGHDDVRWCMHSPEGIPAAWRGGTFDETIRNSTSRRFAANSFPPKPKSLAAKAATMNPHRYSSNASKPSVQNPQPHRAAENDPGASSREKSESHALHPLPRLLR